MTDQTAPRRRGVLALAAVLLLAGCRPPAALTGGRAVVATIYPLAEFARRVGGTLVRVRTLVPPGVEAHDYEPTPRDLAALTRARLFIYNGAGFEPWIERLLAQLPAAVPRVDATAGLPLARAEGRTDPHVWLDPVLAQRQVERIRAALARADPAGRSRYEANAALLHGELAALDADYRKVLERCRRKEFITTHAAFGYLARRYGLRLIGIGGLSPEVEPSAARIKEVVQEARRTGTRVIYEEPRGGSRVAQTIAREIGGTTAVLDPLESLAADAPRAGKTYFTVMRENLERLAQGLDCG